MSRTHRTLLRACAWVCAAALSASALAEPAPASPELDRKFTELAARRSPPRGALAKVTSALIAERLARAQAYASMNRWTEAHEELAAAVRRARRAQSLGAPVDPGPVEERLRALDASGAAYHRAAARTSFEQGDLAEALARLDVAVGLDPDAGRDGPLRAAVWQSWGERELAADAPATAARSWMRALAAAPDPDLEARLAPLRSALGRRALELGACRAAAEWFADVDADAAKTALACARTGVTLSVDTRVDSDAQIGAAHTVRTRTTDLLREHGSPYLALDAITPRTVPSMEGRRSAGPYRIEVRIGEPRFTREPAERVVRRDSAMLDVPGGMLTPVTVSYEEFVEPVVATVSATVSSSGAPTAGAMASLHAVGEGRASARWTGAILGTDSSTAWSSQHTQIVWGPGGDPAARRRAEAARQAAVRRATTLAHESLAEALAERILNDLDREPSLAPPTVGDLAPFGWTPAP